MEISGGAAGEVNRANSIDSKTTQTFAARGAILELKTRIGKSVLGQDRLVESMLIGLLANGNLLIESLPGLAKTRAVRPWRRTSLPISRGSEIKK